MKITTKKAPTPWGLRTEKRMDADHCLVVYEDEEPSAAGNETSDTVHERRRFLQQIVFILSLGLIR